MPSTRSPLQACVRMLTILALFAAGCSVPCIKPRGDLSLAHKQEFCRAMAPYDTEIANAAKRLNVPRSIVSGMIYALSAGKPGLVIEDRLGLMQVHAEEFARARKRLGAYAVDIADDPLNPRANIYAGTWLLSHYYEIVRMYTADPLWRFQVNDWCRPIKAYLTTPEADYENCAECPAPGEGRAEYIGGQVLRYARIQHMCH
ncbi:MAG: transglycosylase SLT domain-containing protein [Desulfatibacillaceae bacterium]